MITTRTLARTFERTVAGIFFSETESAKAVTDHRARVAKAKAILKDPIIAASQATSVSAETKLPAMVVQLDDIGTITKRKVPFVKPIVWDVWDENAPSFNYESLGLVMRSSVLPGRLLYNNYSPLDLAVTRL